MLIPPPPLFSFSSVKQKDLERQNNSSSLDFQSTNPSTISGQVLISNNRDLRPYWNEQGTEWKLRSPAHELFQDLVAINPVFISHIQGKRAASYRREGQNRRKTQGISDSSSSQTSEDGKNSHPYTIYTDVRAGKDVNEHRDEKPKKLQYGARTDLCKLLCVSWGYAL
ncbi:hypothetical protein G9A89_018258 [Geosiphon pyriformis]|nr:hypothetical protein G9A89_018258 [Geosiphon pyriformis]